jgi:hypothetical protein
LLEFWWWGTQTLLCRWLALCAYCSSHSLWIF